MSATNIYESEKLLDEYLLFHYGSKADNMLWECGPINGLEFPKRCAELCVKAWKMQDSETQFPRRALDIGCAVGRSSFELARTFDHVIGIDYSHSFVAACQQLKASGTLAYKALDHGEITKVLTAKIAPDIDRSRCVFLHGDACALPNDLGRFDCVLAANLICRLHSPKSFLCRLSDLIVPGGILVLTTPYSFSSEYTERNSLIGGLVDEDGSFVTGFEGLKALLATDFVLVDESNEPFSIKETARKHQWTVSHATVWKRK